MADNCGDTIGDLHANFLLSFVPNSCAGDVPDHLLVHVSKSNQSDVDHGNVTPDVTWTRGSSVTTRQPDPAPTAVIHTLAPPQGDRDGKDGLDVDRKPAPDSEANGGCAISGHAFLAASLWIMVGLGIFLLST